MQRERGSMVIGPQGAGFPSMSWGSPPEPTPDTATVQVSWDEKPRPSGVVQSSWSNNTPESLAAEITKPKPVYTRTNKDGSPNYNLPNSGPPTPVQDIAFAERVRGGVDYITGGDSIRNQLAYLDDVKSGKRGVDAPTSHHGLASPAPQVAAAEAPAEPPSEPYDWSRHSVGVRTSPEYAEAVRDRASKEAVAAADDKPSVAATPASLQQPEAQQPAEAAERPKMVQQDPKAAVQAEPVPMPAKPMMNPQQRMLAGRSQWRNIEEKNAALVPHYQEAARLLGLGDMDGDTFGSLSPEVAGRLQRKAHSLQRQSSSQQFNDRLSDRNQSREQNVPMALATAQRLQGRGRALLAQAGGLHDADPKKAVLQAQGEQMLAQGEAQQSTFMTAWQRQTDAHIGQQAMLAARMFGRDGAGIVEAHLRGQAAIQQQQLVNAGQVAQQRVANEGQERVAQINAGGHVKGAEIDAAAKEAALAAARIDEAAKLAAAAKERALTREEEARQKELDRTAASDRQKVDNAQRDKEAKDRRDQNPPQLTPPQQHEQLWGPLNAADSNHNDQTPVQQRVDNFVQNLAGQQGLTNEQRAMQGRQAAAWANRHVMSRWENNTLRDSDRGYLRSLAYATADGQHTGKLKDKATFVREMGSHYGGKDWASMAAKLSAFYDRLQKEEKDSANLTQVGIPDNPVV